MKTQDYYTENSENYNNILELCPPPPPPPSAADTGKPIAFVSDCRSPVESSMLCTWSGLRDLLSHCPVGEKDGRAWLASDIDVGPRKGDRVKSVSFLALDIEAKEAKDEPPPEPQKLLEELHQRGLRAYIHTTYSHTPEKPRYRVVFEPNRAIAKEEVRPLAGHLAAILGLSGCADTSCMEPARLFYLPRRPTEGSEFIFLASEGAPLDVNAMLANVNDASTCEAATGAPSTPKTHEASVINAFNAAHEIGEILEARGYISVGGRWLYPESTTGEPGVRLLPEPNAQGFPCIISSHSSDPLNNGRSNDAFDCYTILVHGGDKIAAFREATTLLGFADAHGAHGTDGAQCPDGRLTIRIDPDNFDQDIDLAEQALAADGRFYQAGGLVVTIVDEGEEGPVVQECTLATLTRAVAVAARWEKYSATSKCYVPCPPPERHVSTLLNSQQFKHLRPLAGIARQPYYRPDGSLVTTDGYDAETRLFGAFNPECYKLPETSNNQWLALIAAHEALCDLCDLLGEFRFASDLDKMAALAAIFTAVTRPSYAAAPAFHVCAPQSGSGKSYLCSLIGAFAGPGVNNAVSYPTTAEEANKVMLALLLTNPAVIEFDDMAGDWLPWPVINSMLTSERISGRVLGVSKTATASTRTLFLGSGNNVGPVRDLLRRVLTINLNVQAQSAATLSYRGSPVETLRSQREKYVTAVLTIIEAWRAFGSPKGPVANIVSYNGAWTDYCRHPLVWLGLPDPGSSLVAQVQHDPDIEMLATLFEEWFKVFNDMPVTIRKVLMLEGMTCELMDAIKELPVFERGAIDRRKFGWYLKKNSNRVVKGYVLKQTTASAPAAWQVKQIPKA